MIKFKGYTENGNIKSGLDKVVDGLNVAINQPEYSRAYDKDGSRLRTLLFGTINDEMKKDIEVILSEIFEKERRLELLENTLEIDLQPDNTLVAIQFSTMYKGAKVNFIYHRGDEN